MLSIPKYPQQYAQHFPAIFYLLCCASQHHVFLLKGYWSDRHKQLLRRTAVDIKTSFKYLGVLFGEVSPEQTYAPLMATAQARASYAASLPLTVPKCISLLQEWILPLLI